MYVASKIKNSVVGKNKTENSVGIMISTHLHLVHSATEYDFVEPCTNVWNISTIICWSATD